MPSAPATSPARPAWQRCWLAECLREQETRGGRLDDAQVVAQLRGEGGPLREAILRRAEWLLVQPPWQPALSVWLARARWGALLAALLLLLSGVLAALAALGDGQRPVNLLWALLVLLGAHLGSLLLWLLAWLRPARPWGQGWWRLLGRSWPGAGAAADRPAWRALGALLRRQRVWLWAVSALSHALWAVLLLGMLLGLLAALSLQRYDFVWETTLLPAPAFPALFAVIGAPPSWLGFALPDPAAVLASGAAPDPAARQAWASWLLGCVLAYGLLPRSLLALLCGARARRGWRRLQPDWDAPYYQALAARLAPASERIAERDPADAQLPRIRIDAAAVAGHGIGLVGLELRSDLAWPPPGLADCAPEPPIDSREQRHAVLARLRTAPLQRLLLAVDARLSPDRSSLALLAELSQHAAASAVWLQACAQASVERQQAWRAALAELGVPPGRVFDQAATACAWLRQGAEP